MARPPIIARPQSNLFKPQLDAALDYIEANAGGGGSPAWVDITGKPATFPPDAHTHPLSALTQSGATSGQVAQWNGSSWVPANQAASGQVTVTVPNNAMEWEEAVAASVNPGQRITVSLAGVNDDEENDPELLDVASVAALAGSGALTVTIAFATPAAGPVKLNWIANG